MNYELLSMILGLWLLYGPVIVESCIYICVEIGDCTVLIWRLRLHKNPSLYALIIYISVVVWAATVKIIWRLKTRWRLICVLSCLDHCCDWSWRVSCVGGKCFLSGAAWSWMCWLKLRHYQLHEASSCPHSACDWYIVLAALKTVYYADWLLVTDIKKPMYDWYILIYWLIYML